MSKGSLEKVCDLPGGYALYREENGVGGHRYWTDSIDSGVVVWDTSLVSRPEMIAALFHEEVRDEEERRVAAVAQWQPW